jgi:hypothetical protein
MEPSKGTMAVINVVGGTVVLGSYAYGLATHPDTAGAVWGGVPEWLKPYYTASMLSAAAGYFLFSYFLFFRVDSTAARVASRFDFDLFNFLYLFILVPSAMWMPLTFRMIEAPNPALWATIRIVLGIVGVASVALIVSLLLLNRRQPAWAYVLGIVGSLAFAVQTALLDAIVWPAYFPL